MDEAYLKKKNNFLIWILSIFLLFTWIALTVAFWWAMSFIRELKEPQLLQTKGLFITILAIIGGVYVFTMIAFILLIVLFNQNEKEIYRRFKNIVE